MKVFYEPPDVRGALVTIGNFDGVHIGHRKVIGMAYERAVALRKKLIAITFWPHPSVFFGKPVKLIQTLNQRLLSLREMVDATLVIKFDLYIAVMEPEDFIEYLRNRMHFEEIFVGKGFRFGRGRKGSADFLKELGREKGFKVWDIDKVFYGGEKVSSTRIRKLLEEGKVKEASVLLGRPYSVEGVRIKGKGVGRTLGFPTVNILPENSILPRGVFAGYIKKGKRILRAAIYIGSRPTFDDSEISVEAYSVEGELNVRVGERVEIFLVDRLRDERKFSDVNDLRKSIEQDVLRVLSM